MVGPLFDDERLAGSNLAGCMHRDAGAQFGDVAVLGEPDVGLVSENEPEPRFFWVTTRGIITAIAGLLTATAALIGALNAAGVIGSDDGGTPTTSTASPTLEDAVLDGEYAVIIQVATLSGSEFLGENKLWSFANPLEGQRLPERWTLKSTCVDQPCDATWDTNRDTNSGKFGTLQRDGGKYTESVTGTAQCQPERAPVSRTLALHVTDAAEIAGVWTATRIMGELSISWVCNGEAVNGELTVDGGRAGPA